MRYYLRKGNEMALASVIDTTWYAPSGMHVREKHTDSSGESYYITYTAPTGYDMSSALSAHAAELAERLAEQELEALLNG